MALHCSRWVREALDPVPTRTGMIARDRMRRRIAEEVEAGQLPIAEPDSDLDGIAGGQDEAVEQDAEYGAELEPGPAGTGEGPE